MDVCSHVGFWPVGLLHCMSPEVALLRHHEATRLSPLCGAERLRL